MYAVAMSQVAVGVADHASDPAWMVHRTTDVGCPFGAGAPAWNFFSLPIRCTGGVEPQMPTQPMPSHVQGLPELGERGPVGAEDDALAALGQEVLGELVGRHDLRVSGRPGRLRLAR